MEHGETSGTGTYRFRWLASDRIPTEYDLRRCGWTLDTGCEPSGKCIGVIHAGCFGGVDWKHMLATLNDEVRRFVLVIGIASARERATLLQIGFGDAVSDTIDIEELAARASRVAEFTRWLPRHRRLGDLQLDLLAREAYRQHKPLNLNPREFALLWRLADSPNEPVTKQSLIHDVWRMGFVPETNSIAVHMSRLRRKLSFVGLGGIIVTSTGGSYSLQISDERFTTEPATLPMIARATVSPIIAHRAA